MADIAYNRNRELVSPTEEMKKKLRLIQIQERKSQIKGLQLQIKNLETIEKPKLRLAIEGLEQEINHFEAQNKKIIDVEVTQNGGSNRIATSKN